MQGSFFHLDMLIRKVGFCSIPQASFVCEEKGILEVGSFPRIHTWKLLTQVLIVAVRRVLGEKVVSQALNIDCQSSHPMVMFRRNKDRQQISGEGKWRLREAVVNGACFPLCTTGEYVICSSSEKHMIAQLGTYSPLNTSEAASNTAMIMSWLIMTWNPVSRKYAWHKALKFSVQSGWNEQLNFPFSLLLFSFLLPPPFVNS